MNAPFSQVSRIHLTGIKGVAMTALAQCFLDLGKQVTGSDVEEDFVTKEMLEKNKIPVAIGFSADHLQENTDLVVYSGAHHGSDNAEVVAARSKNIPTLSHAVALGELMQGKQVVSVCGVGGKSTVSAMITWILDYAGLHPSYAVGVGEIFTLERTGRYVPDSAYFVAEADEYATDPGKDNTPRFMHQDPYVIVCTNLAFDHPDVYKDFSATKEAYLAFFRKLPENGVLIINADNKYLVDLTERVKKERGGKIQIIPIGKNNTKTDDWGFGFNYHAAFGITKCSCVIRGTEQTLEIGLPGEFNLQNAMYAVTAAVQLGVQPEKALEAIKLFKSTKRRFEHVGTENGIEYYDDYAHHPSEITATLKALREWFPKNRIVALFQSHTNSRTKSLLREFSESFHDADSIFLIDIFSSAREKNDPTVSSDLLAELITKQGREAKNLRTIEEAGAFLKNFLKSGDVFITLGAGDLYRVHDYLK